MKTDGCILNTVKTQYVDMVTRCWCRCF